MLWDSGGDGGPVGATKEVVEGWNDGSFARWEKASSWGITSSNTRDGTLYAARRAAAGGGDAIAYLPQANMSRPFEPGTVLHVPYHVTDIIDIYFGDQSFSPGNQYELNIRNGGPGWSLRREASVDGNGRIELGEELSPYELRQNTWAHAYIAWDPADYYSGANDPRDTDGSNVGDFLVAIFGEEGRPLSSKYIPANNTYYRSGGISLVIGGTYSGTVDEIEVGDSPAAFPRFKPNRIPRPDEIACFNNADVGAWDSFTDRTKFRLARPGEVTPYEGDFCLAMPGDSDYKEMFSAPGNPGDQEYPLPNYPGPGTVSELAVRSSSLSNFLGVVYGSTGSRSNSVRFEFRFGSNSIRAVQYDSAGNQSTTYFDAPNAGLSTGQWIRPVVDRSGGDFRFYVLDVGGQTIFGPRAFTPPAATRNASGVGLVGTNNSQPFYVDGWRLQ